MRAEGYIDGFSFGHRWGKDEDIGRERAACALAYVRNDKIVLMMHGHGKEAGRLFD